MAGCDPRNDEVLARRLIDELTAMTHLTAKPPPGMGVFLRVLFADPQMDEAARARLVWAYCRNYQAPPAQRGNGHVGEGSQ